MSENPNEITIENSVLILVDHQPWVAFSVKSIDAALLGDNLAGPQPAPRPSTFRLSSRPWAQQADRSRTLP